MSKFNQYVIHYSEKEDKHFLIRDSEGKIIGNIVFDHKCKEARFICKLKLEKYEHSSESGETKVF